MIRSEIRLVKWSNKKPFPSCRRGRALRFAMQGTLHLPFVALLRRRGSNLARRNDSKAATAALSRSNMRRPSEGGCGDHRRHLRRGLVSEVAERFRSLRPVAVEQGGHQVA